MVCIYSLIDYRTRPFGEAKWLIPGGMGCYSVFREYAPLSGCCPRGMVCGIISTSRRCQMALIKGTLGKVLNALLKILTKGKEAGVFDQKQGPSVK